MGISQKNLILINANILTLDPFCPPVTWLAARDEKIFRIGKGKKWKAHKDKDSIIIDCRGRTVIPGFIDTHTHFLSYAKSLVTPDLSPAKNVHSISDILAIIKRDSSNRPSGQWIFGRGYNEFYLSEKRHPDRQDLDKATPDHPVRLTHRSGHIHVLNSLALKLAGITRGTGDPDGGIIERDLKTGDPTGLLYEMGDFLYDRIPALSHAASERGLQLANRGLISLGITSIQDASSHNDIQQWNFFRSLKESGGLNPRINLMMGINAFKKNAGTYELKALNKNHLQWGAVKIILDDTTGRLHPSQSKMNEMVLKIHQAGKQVAIHALEEKAIESACAAIQFAVERSPVSDHRHRIEHCAICPPDLARKIASLDIFVVTQPAFIYFHGERYLNTISGKQLRYLYPVRTLLEQGINVAAGSDCPVTPPDPLIGIHAAIHRMASSKEIVGGREKIKPDEALRMYTLNAARATFEERIKGTLTPGNLADLVVLNTDPIQLAEEHKNMRVDMTIIGGRVVWERKD